MKDIGKQITALRKEKDMTQEQLANLIGVSAQTVSKWECATTMPDILLLPILAEIFDVNIDTLFGIERKNEPLTTQSELPEAAVDLLLHLMWCEGAPEEEGRQQLFRMRQALDANSDCQSMRIMRNAAGIFVDKQTAVVNRMPRQLQTDVLENTDAAAFLSACTVPHVMQLLRYQLENNARSFTAATAAVKCGISEEEAASALDVLTKYNLTLCHIVDLPDGTITVYSSHAEHKLLLLSALYAIAAKLADYKESYQGFSN